MKSMDVMRFRQADATDADAIAALHVASWRETYNGILPDEVLDGLSVEARSAMWGAVLGGSVSWNGTNVFIAQNGRELVGFGACGEQRDGELRERGFHGEIGAVYVLQTQQRSDVGKALMGLMARSLLDRGRKAASLWVVRENVRARTFYERLGGVLLGEKVEELSGTNVVEVAYGWSDLGSLAR
jgi:ribosomal protein S18 acetylase RimI-like enzyme